MKNILREWRGTVFVGLVILLFTAVIRFVNLNSLPVFADEAIYIRWAQVMRTEPTLRFLPLSDGKQPLFMWLTIPFLKVFTDPLFAGRVVSILSGVGTQIGIFVLSYLFFKSKKVSLLAAFIYAFLPFTVFFDRLALSDSLLSMFGVWSLFFVVLTVKTLRLDFAMIAGFALGGALITKSPALYFSLMLPLSVIFIKSKKDIPRALVLLIPTYLIAYGMYNALRLGPNFHMLAIRNLDYVYPVSHILSSPLDPFKPFVDRVREYYVILSGVAFMLIWLGTYVVNLRKYWKEVFILSVWLLFPILVSSEFSKTMTARYVYFTLPYFIILTAAFFLTNKKKIYHLGVVLLFLAFFQALKLNYNLLTNPAKADIPRSERSGYLEEWTAGTGIAEIAAFLKGEEAKLKGDERIVVGTEGFFGTLPDGLQMYFEGNSKVIVIGIGLQLDAVPSQLADSKKAGNPTYLVANDERMNVNYEDINLKLIAKYPKATRPDGSYQSLVLFEVTDEISTKL